MKPAAYKIAIAFILAFGIGDLAWAEVPQLTPLNFTARYNVAWNGLPIGRINLTIAEDPFTYSMVIDTKTSGLAKLFSDERTVAQVKGRKPDATHYVATTYESRPQAEGDGRHILMTYNPDGTIATRERTPADDPAWRPVVPLAQANEATDPMTAALILRQQLRNHMAAETRDTMVKTYDAARLAVMHFKVISRARIEALGEYRDGINLVVSRTPITGYTPKELKKYKKGDPVIHLYFSADEKFIPLRATASTSFGELSATLVKMK